MNDKDTEEFNKWFRSLENASQLLMFGLDVEYLKVWKAACDHFQLKIDEKEEQEKWLVSRMNWDYLDRDEIEKMKILYRKHFPDNF